MLIGEAVRHIDAELQNQISTSVTVHKCAQGVVIVDGHAFANENFAGLGTDHLISCELDSLSIKSLELNWVGAQSLLQRDSVVVNEIVAESSHVLAFSGVQNDNQVAHSLQLRVVSFPRESNSHAVLHAGLNKDVSGDSGNVLVMNNSFVSSGGILSASVGTSVFYSFSCTIEEFLQAALHIHGQVSFFDRLVGYIILVQIGLYFLNHGDLLSLVVQSNVEGIHSSKERLENLHRVSAKAVSFVRIISSSVLKSVLTIAVIHGP